MSGAASSSARPLDPWQRYGWLLWSVWLLFLVFPLTAVVQADRPTWARLVAVLALLAFAAIYAVSTLRLSRDACGGRDVALVLAALVLLGLAATPVIGLEAIAVVPFLQSFTMFALPRPWCWIAAAAAVAATIVLPAAAGEPAGFYFTLIVLGVAAGTGAGRLMSEHGAEYSRVNDELTVADERERVARDVHDVLGHSLTVVSVKAELAARLVDVDPARARAELADIQALTRQALSEVRSTVGGLRAAVLEEELTSAAEALRSADIEADLPATTVALDPRRRTVAAWVLREAVTNVVRHSGARRCWVELDTTRLRVLDDGCGLAEGAPPGNGLRGLRERVTASGGRLHVGPAPEGGTLLEVAW